MELWTAFILGTVGSLHCAGMCGPLVLAMPAAGHGPTGMVLGRLAYNLGRILTYGLLGAAFGLLGGALAFVGIARWVSVAAGVLILAGWLFSSRPGLSLLIAKMSLWTRRPFGHFLRQRTVASSFLLGTLNGLLPCGLVYAAGAVAVTVGGSLGGLAYMIAFGLGTVPMMLAIGLFGAKLQFALRARFQSLIPACLVATSVLLVLRGLALGIPFLSPGLAPGQPHCPLCLTP